MTSRRGGAGAGWPAASDGAILPGSAATELESVRQPRGDGRGGCDVSVNGHVTAIEAVSGQTCSIDAETDHALLHEKSALRLRKIIR
jgi:hypothetical protein